MEEKVKTSRKKRVRRKGVRKPFVLFTPDNTIEILKMYYEKKISMQEIGIYFGVTRQRIWHVIKAADMTKTDHLAAYDHTAIIKRGNMDEFERAKLISNDAQELAENLLSIANYSIKHTVKLLEENKDNPEIAMSAINIDKITKLIQVVAPYTLTPTKVSGKVGKHETPKSKLSQFMTPLRKAE